MSAYATWDLYQAYYGEIEDEAAFDRMNYRVSGMLDVFTGRRAERATGHKAARLNDCACALIDLLADIEKSGAGRGLSSVSNDGYAESYAATSPEQISAMLRSTAFQRLSGTGLMGAL